MRGKSFPKPIDIANSSADANEGIRLFRRLYCLWLFLLGLAITSAMGQSQVPRLRGITLERMQMYPSWDKKQKAKYTKFLSEVSAAIASHSSDHADRWMTTRVVFDFVDDAVVNDEAHLANYVNWQNYAEAVRILRREAKSQLMGQIIDSQALPRCDRKCVQQRSEAFVQHLSPDVDIWEIGNEVNGEWAGDIGEVLEKIQIAYDAVNRLSPPDRRLETALTLYYNKACVPQDHPENEMFRWLEDNKGRLTQMSPTYVLISYYEKDCNNDRPDWATVFRRLSDYFPHSYLGFGEVGAKDKKSEYLKRYYGTYFHDLSRDTQLRAKFVGGFFWWRYRDDMVPRGKDLWNDLTNVLATWEELTIDVPK